MEKVFVVSFYVRYEGIVAFEVFSSREAAVSYLYDSSPFEPTSVIHEHTDDTVYTNVEYSTKSNRVCNVESTCDYARIISKRVYN
jgi:hypothetical protein